MCVLVCQCVCVCVHACMCVCLSMLIPVIYLRGRRKRKLSIMACLLLWLLFVKADKGMRSLWCENAVAVSVTETDPVIPAYRRWGYHSSISNEDVTKRKKNKGSPHITQCVFTRISIMWSQNPVNDLGFCE